MSLAESLERAATALPERSESIRPANGDPTLLLEALEIAEAAEVLAWLLAHETEAGGELALAWSEVARGAEVLAQVTDEGLGKGGRKALRRALHVARTRGFSLPEPSPAEVVATLPQIEDELGGAFVSPLDPSGARVVVLIERNPSGGARVFETVLDDDRGILHFDAFVSTRGHARRFQRSITRREHFAAIPVDANGARALVARAVARQPQDHPLPQGFLEWRSRIAKPGEGEVTPGQQAREALGGDTVAERLERAVEMVRAGEVGPWPPAESVLAQEATRFEEVARSPIVVSGSRRQEQLESALEEAGKRIYDPQFAGRTAERFEESAYVFWKSGREEDARACLAAADAFRGQSPAECSVARALLERVMAPLLKQAADETEDSEDSLLVRP